MKILRVHLTAFTASFRMPFSYTGVQVTIPVPSYSNLLGLLGCAIGDLVDTTISNIGFNFYSEGKSTDLERIIRWDSIDPMKPRLNPKGPAIRRREFLLNPSLFLYLTNLELQDNFLFPKGIITLGRSQDVARIEDVGIFDVVQVNEGSVGGTLIPVTDDDHITEGMFLRLPECIEYDQEKRTRKFSDSRLFVATDPFNSGINHLRKEVGLYKLQDTDEVFYLHEW